MAIHVLFKNLFYSSISQITRLFTNSILFIFIAREFGIDGFGYFTTSHSYYAFFLLLADFGIETYILTLFQKEKNLSDQVISELLSIKIILILFAFVALLVLSAVLNLASETKIMLVLLGIALIGSSTTSFFSSILKSKEQFRPDAIINTIQNLFLLCAIVVVWYFNLSVILQVVLFTISRFMGLYVLYSKVKEHCSIKLNFETKTWRQHKNNLITYGLHLVFGTLFFTSDSLLIPLFYNEKIAGEYQAVFKLAVLALLLSDVITMTYLPTLSRLYQQDKNKWNAFSNFIHKIITISGVVFGIIFYVFANEIIVLIYGNTEFYKALDLMKIFGIIIFIRSATIVYGFLITSASLQHMRMKITIYATVFNVISNIIVLPHYGIMGSAIISLITNILVGIYFINCVAKLEFIFDHKFTLHIVLSVLLFSIIMLIIVPMYLKIFGLLFLFFFIILAVIGSFTNSEKSYFQLTLISIFEKINYRS